MCDRNPQGHFTPERGIHEQKHPCLQVLGGWARVEVQLGLRALSRGLQRLQVSFHPAGCPVPSPPALLGLVLSPSARLLPLLPTPREEHSRPPFPGFHLLSSETGVLGPASLSVKRHLRPVQVGGGGVHPACYVGAGPEAVPMVRSGLPRACVCYSPVNLWEGRF